jgi:hypothetical protein
MFEKLNPQRKPSTTPGAMSDADVEFLSLVGERKDALVHLVVVTSRQSNAN